MHDDNPTLPAAADEPRRKPVSKSLRFEVLRRDNHTCRYCGASAPDVKLTVDHVIPVALGGTDDPTNLVTACADCNSGKAATPADAQTVADVAADALRWRAAIEVAAAAASNELLAVQAYRDVFRKAWNGWTFGDEKYRVPAPADWANTVDRFYEMGLPTDLLIECIRVAMRSKVSADATFRYMCGVAWRKIAALQDAARDITLTDNGKA